MSKSKLRSISTERNLAELRPWAAVVMCEGLQAKMKHTMTVEQQLSEHVKAIQEDRGENQIYELKRLLNRKVPLAYVAIVFTTVCMCD